MDTRKPIAHAGQFWRLKNGEIAYISSISDAQTVSPISGRRIAADTYEMWAADGKMFDPARLYSDRDLDVPVEFTSMLDTEFKEGVVRVLSHLTTLVEGLLKEKEQTVPFKVGQEWLNRANQVVTILSTSDLSMAPMRVSRLRATGQTVVYSLHRDGMVRSDRHDDDGDLVKYLGPTARPAPAAPTSFTVVRANSQ